MLKKEKYEKEKETFKEKKKEAKALKKLNQESDCKLG